MRSVQEIQTMVAQHYRLPLAAMEGHQRNRYVAWPRMMAMYLARKYTAANWPRLALEFNRDHSAVFYAVKRVPFIASKDRAFAQVLSFFELQLQANAA